MNGHTLGPDRAALDTFVGAMFRYADPDTLIGLRAFVDGKRGEPPIFTNWAAIGDGRTSEWVFNSARRAAEFSKPGNFCPPICTFANQDKADEASIANGLVLTVECDSAPEASRRKLEVLIGPATLVVASGGEWTDPATGEVQQKLHLHWRLTEPTRDTAAHALLKEARRLACYFADADATAVPLNHPLRWPGSVHRKGAPRLARITAQTENEVELADVLATLREACPDAPKQDATRHPGAGLGFSQDLAGDLLDITAALAVIPNHDLTWDAWNRIAMATWAASAGAAFAAFDAWSRKSAKYDAAVTADRWDHIGHHPPTSIGAGTLYHLARETASGWRKPSSWARDADRQEAPRQKSHQDHAAPAGDPEDPVTALMKRFNDRYMLVNEAGKAIVLNPGYDPVLKRRRYDRLTVRDLQTLYLNELIQVGQDDKKRPVFKTAADVWLKHPDRRQYINGIAFDPTGQQQDGVLNLWEGYAVKSEPGDWTLMRDHIRNIICDGDDIRFTYLMGWMARMLQHPAEQGEVAVVMRGGEGSGKGTLAKALMRIVGHHGLAIANAKHLVGNFNAHLRDVIFLFADEAFFAGDRSHIGALKSLITEPHLPLEGKFQNVVLAPNFLHLMMASNEDWVVPASLDARRFFVLEVPDGVKGDHAYFARIWKQMDAGGYAAMLADLLAYDLTGFNVRSVPTTEGLQQQRKLSLPVTESWWLDCLERGYVYRSKIGLDDDFGHWLDVVATELLFLSYSEFAKQRGERRPLTREGLGKFLTSLGAVGSQARNMITGEHMTDVPNGFGGTGRKAAAIRRERSAVYKFGDIRRARADFCRATRIPLTWDDEHLDRESDDTASVREGIRHGWQEGVKGTYF